MLRSLTISIGKSRRDDTLSSHCAVPAGLYFSTLDKSCRIENHYMFFIFHPINYFRFLFFECLPFCSKLFQNFVTHKIRYRKIDK